MARQRGFDRTITLFSPEGKLFQIEYAFKAIRLPGDTTIGVRGEGAVCLITQKKVEDKLVDPSSVTRMFKIINTIGCCVTGRRSDGVALVYKARELANDFKYQNGFDMPVAHLAQEIANYNQVFTQRAIKRVVGVSMMLIAMDDEAGAKLYMVDPAGAIYGYKAVASGAKEQEAMSALEKLVKEKEEERAPKGDADKPKAGMNYKETVEAAIESLQKVLGVDFKSNQVEVAVVSADDPTFRVLPEETVDAFLTAISEDRD